MHPITSPFPRAAARFLRAALLPGLLPVLLLLGAACSPDADVVLYCALDQAHSEPIVALFEQQTGLDVEAYYDVEASKSVGLRRRLQAGVGDDEGAAGVWAGVKHATRIAGIGVPARD